MAPIDILTLMNDEDAVAIRAARDALADVAQLVELAAERVRGGGRVHYFGAGTSGRLGVLDAAELRPTFNLPAGEVIAHIAGGPDALTEAVESAEDSWASGTTDAGEVGPGDVVIGLTASGSTPYVGGALEQSRRAGALTALIACNPDPELEALADIVVVADTGPEVLSGSTRLKAATAEKVLLNAFSTALMITLGRTWQGLMVSVVATNEKLRDRTSRILAEALGINVEAAAPLLDAAGGDLRAALVVGLTGAGLDDARSALAARQGSVAGALELLGR